jgi:hypothetical protein
MCAPKESGVLRAGKAGIAAREKQEQSESEVKK